MEKWEEKEAREGGKRRVREKKSDYRSTLSMPHSLAFLLSHVLPLFDFLCPLVHLTIMLFPPCILPLIYDILSPFRFFLSFPCFCISPAFSPFSCLSSPVLLAFVLCLPSLIDQVRLSVQRHSLIEACLLQALLKRGRCEMLFCRSFAHMRPGRLCVCLRNLASSV